MKLFLTGVTLVSLLNSCQSGTGDDSLQTSDRRHDGSQVHLAAYGEIIRPAGDMILNRSIPHTDNRNVSYCEAANGESNRYNGFRDQTKYPLASVSKVFLSAWVIDRLGPDFQFENAWYIKPVDKAQGIYDAYYRSNYDPIVNIEKMLYAVSLMNYYGIKKIRNLVIDESTRIYLNVLDNPHVELATVPVSTEQSIANLKTILNSSQWGAQTEKAKYNLRNYILQKNLKLSVPQSFSVDQVTYQSQNQIQVNTYANVIKIKSARMLNYLKQINANSNNYLSDAFYNLLGGSSGFRSFQSSRLKIASQDLEMVTGSGIEKIINGSRVDNKGTCVSVLRILKFMDEISNQLNFNLGHVLLTVGAEAGTYVSNQPIAFNQSVVVKTGRLFEVPTLNIAGVANMSKGKVYFSYLAHNFNNSEEAKYQNIRDDLIKSLMSFYPVRTGFSVLKTNSVFVE